MELILKPTSKCNFACTFCSASQLNLQHLTEVPYSLKQLLEILKPTNIIITGGDPLTINPEIYFELLELGSWNISLTTNLKDFIINPYKWITLFKNKRVGICTSFQYGENRRFSEQQIYNEKMFIDTINIFNKYIGYIPSFISVIDNHNKHQAINHLYLAKHLGTKCKINRMMPLGSSNEQYPLYKLIQLYLDIYDKQLDKYCDFSTSLYNGGCGFNINGLCQSTIRAVMFDNEGNLKYATCEDDLILNNFIQQEKIQPIPQREKISYNEHLNVNCMFCELFYLCHGCKHNRKLNKFVPEHCIEMQKLKSKILDMEWKLQP